jgi:DNA-binding Xre family transcriptional regulator
MTEALGLVEPFSPRRPGLPDSGRYGKIIIMGRDAVRPGPVGRELSALIRERMARKRMTQAEMVRATGIPQWRLSRILRDLLVATADDLVAVAGALDISPGELIDAAWRARKDAE